MRLDGAHLQRIFRQAEGEYPSECCGVVTAAVDGSSVEVHACRNIQERLHGEDPVQHPRDARKAYYIDPHDLHRILTDVDRRGRQVVGFYHSHVDCEAYFSDEDRDRAMTWGEPAYPEAVYLVISVRQGRAHGHACFTWSGVAGRFVEVDPAGP